MALTLTMMFACAAAGYVLGHGHGASRERLRQLREAEERAYYRRINGGENGTTK